MMYLASVNLFLLVLDFRSSILNWANCFDDFDNYWLFQYFMMLWCLKCLDKEELHRTGLHNCCFLSKKRGGFCSHAVLLIVAWLDDLLIIHFWDSGQYWRHVRAMFYLYPGIWLLSTIYVYLFVTIVKSRSSSSFWQACAENTSSKYRELITSYFCPKLNKQKHLQMKNFIL